MKAMLASPTHDDTMRKYLEQGGMLMLSPKLDGIRGLVRNGVVYGRSAKPLPNRHIQKELANPLYQHFDGELVVGPPNEGEVYKRSYSGVMTITGEPEFTFWVFDHTELPDAPYMQRYQMLRDIGVARVLPQKMVTKWEDLLAFEVEMLEQGFEGFMARIPSAKYSPGKVEQKNPTEKSLWLMKGKREEDREAKIISCYEAMKNNNEAFIDELGRTARSTHKENLSGKGMLGGFMIDVDGVVSKCAPGTFDHKERVQIWEQWLADPESIKRLFLKIRHFPYGADKKPRFPRARGFRDPIDMGE